jgi:hypothetical protein
MKNRAANKGSTITDLMLTMTGWYLRTVVMMNARMTLTMKHIPAIAETVNFKVFLII